MESTTQQPMPRVDSPHVLQHVPVNHTELTPLSLLPGEHKGGTSGRGQDHPCATSEAQPYVSLSCGQAEQRAGTGLRRCFPGVAAW